MRITRELRDHEIVTALVAATLSNGYPNDTWSQLVDRSETLLREIVDRTDADEAGVF